MLCPRKKRVYPVKDNYGGDVGTAEEFLECEKEKCAWWVPDKKIIKEKNESKSMISILSYKIEVLKTGNCSIKLRAENEGGE